MQRKKVLFVVNNFNVGGPQKSLLSLLYKLSFEKLDVSLLSLNGEGSLTKYLPKEVKLLDTPREVKYAILTPNNFMKDSINLLFSQYFSFPLRAIPKVILGLRQKYMTKNKQYYWLEIKDKLPQLNQDFDVAIGVSGGHSIMYIADCVNAATKVGWIRTDYRVLGRDNNLDAEYFKQMKKIISVSKLCKDIFVEIFPEEEKKMHVMYNILPFEMYNNIKANTKDIKKEKESYKLLSVSRLDPNKGLDLAIDALKILLNKGYDIKWFILGDGNYRKELENKISENGLLKNFILLGFHINTAAFIKESDLVIHPSRFEGKSNVVDEAKYLLKPIVATNYNTVSEQLIHGKNGLISEMNADSLAANIEKLLLSNELKDLFKENLLVERYDDSISLKTFYNVIDL
ncbi:glycosyltransferase [Virgibacillus halodenitrificans]|uniref:Glycosyltransferase n=1 Tax=Virgibacillus halodenitrificans TaxID=1482 RepID=A0ABR7VLC9_VIRHA|nr:glycosyltransferase [Virgibacillus halodenitrificans]MBD1221302.1 glycosyltransferase [Virgibacillus halodenitrificans]